MDEHPEVLSDLWVLYRLDFDEQIGKPRVDLLVQCIERLPYEPWSRWRARELGGEKWLGWDLHAALIADLIDAINFQTSATAVNKKAKLSHPVERPEPKKQTIERRPESVADMRWGDALTSLHS